MSYIANSKVAAPWVGDLPDEWRSDWLKWNVRLCKERPTEEQIADLPYISNEDIASWTGKLLNSDPQPAEADGRLFNYDDVLFNKLRPYLAKAYHAQFNGISSGELLCLRPTGPVIPRYLFYVITSKGFIDTVDSETFGSKMPRADWEIVGHQPLPLPPIANQRRIVEFLDNKTVQIDALIEKKGALLDRLAEKRQTLITHAITKGLDPTVPMRDSGINWLGKIPANWDVKPLRYAAKNLNNMRVPIAAELRKGIERKYPYYGASGIIDYVDDFIFDFPTVLVAEDGANLLSRSTPLAFTASGKYWVNNHAHILRPISLSAWYCSSILAMYPLEPYITGSAQPKLTKDNLSTLNVWVPPPDEQMNIEASVSKNVSTIESVENSLRASLDQLIEYRSALITAAVTGQLDLDAA